ncbi:AraC family transcriptional regulator [Paenibacillus agaridevorans]|uniref:AraC family transcriptional regulator n=1 Tax=Paenibacillus agaridevorans TaxID=171404 RepID=A0A2R5EX46_9BACL|nr:helix-turn-helix domain-containing protein [Paenibacillus agaridevorans]GBG11230.1 AraC family transcriptional regulator [Paenibacillus agaridevorans]
MLLKRKSIIFPWLLSYVVILLIPVLTGVYIYMKSNQTIVGEIDRSNNLILSKVQQDIDTLLEDVNRLSVEIALNPQVQELLTIQGPLEPSQYFTIYKTFESLKVYKSSNRWNDYFVYFKEIDTIITPELSNTSESIYHSQYKKSNSGYRDWVGKLEGYYQGDYVMIGDDLAFIRSIPIIKNGSTLGNIVIFLDQAKFWVNNAEAHLHNGAAAIIDSSDQVLASSRPLDDPLPVFYHEMPQDSGVLKVNDGERELVVSYISSDSSEWKYVIMTPGHIYWDKVEGIKRATIMSLFLCLCVGFGLTYTFVRRNYSPVRGMVEMFKEKKSNGKENNNGINEYEFMKQEIHSTLIENKEMGGKLWRQKGVMRDHFLEKLLKGRDSAIPLQQLMELHEMAFVSENFAVMILHIEDYNTISPSLVHFAVMNVTEELTNQLHQGFTAEIDEFIVCLINFNVVQELDWKRDLFELANHLLKFMETKYGVPVTIAMSRLHSSATGISKAYYEAVEVMEYQSIYGVSGVMDYLDMEAPRAKGEYYYPLEKEQALINSIKAGDYKAAESIVDEVFKHNLEQRQLPLQLAKCLFVDLVGTLMKTMNGISGMYDNDNGYLENLNPIERLLGSQTVSEMKLQLKNMLRDICDAVGLKQVGKRTNDILLKVSDILTAQYNDVNLSIASIAEQIGLHPAYVSKLYKDGTGDSLLDDIGKYRVEKAKLIMKEQNLTIEEVSQLVGFSNVRTFRRAFTKYEGITPGKYSGTMD